VVNSLLSAIPEIGNVSLVCLIFWLIFSVMGVQFFGGRFYKCLDDDGEVLSHTTVANKTGCLAMNYTWKNSDINFDNSLAGFLALFQVVCSMVSVFIGYRLFLNSAVGKAGGGVVGGGWGVKATWVWGHAPPVKS
jgi:hypothetical protein